MKEVFHRYRHLFAAVISIFAILLFFSLKLSTYEGDNSYLLIFKNAADLLTVGWNKVLKKSDDVYDHYVNLHDAAVKNTELMSTNQELQARLLTLEEKTLEINRLRILLEFKEKSNDPLTFAEVYGGRYSSPFKTLTLSKGKSSGIAVGMPVISGKGVVGRILRVRDQLSEVQLLVDYDFHLDVLIQRNRVRSILVGNSRDDATLHVQKGTDVRIGDVIVTSGIVGSFPKGIPVGIVTQVSFESERVSQLVTIEPYVDWKRVDEVIVLLKNDANLEKIVKVGGEEWLDKSLDRKIKN